MFLFLDTETTGLPTRRGAHYTELDAWPRMVSACWAFYSPTGKELHYEYHIIRPDSFTIPHDVTLIHGITTERALHEGIPLATVLQKLATDIGERRPQLAVAHNMAFDQPVLLAEYLRIGLAQPMTSLRSFCTMVSTTELVRLPPFRYGKHKWPKLAELYYHLFGMDFPSGHHAGADVKACAACFFELQRRGLAPRLS